MSNSGPFALIAVVVVVALLGAKAGPKNGIPCKCHTGKGYWQPGRLRNSEGGPVFVPDRRGAEEIAIPGTHHLDVRDVADDERFGAGSGSRVFVWKSAPVKLAIRPAQEQAVRNLLAEKPDPQP